MPELVMYKGKKVKGRTDEVHNSGINYLIHTRDFQEFML